MATYPIHTPNKRPRLFASPVRPRIVRRSPPDVYLQRKRVRQEVILLRKQRQTFWSRVENDM